MRVVLNNRVEATIDVGIVASKSCMTSGMLAELRLQMPVASQRPIMAVRFTLGNNSEAATMSRNCVHGYENIHKARFNRDKWSANIHLTWATLRRHPVWGV